MLKINFWKRNRNEKGELVDEYQRSLELVGNEFLIEERRALSVKDSVLKIPPGETLQAWTTIKFPKIEPGNYLAELIYYAVPVTREEKESYKYLIVGEYHADLQELIVVKK